MGNSFTQKCSKNWKMLGFNKLFKFLIKMSPHIYCYYTPKKKKLIDLTINLESLLFFAFSPVKCKDEKIFALRLASFHPSSNANRSSLKINRNRRILIRCEYELIQLFQLKYLEKYIFG